jgi:hypothetical protein
MPEQHGTARPRRRAKEQNALKHGVYSREIMLPGERMRDYEALGVALNEEWVPDGPTEHGLVDRLVALYWRKQRLERYEHSSLQQRVDQIHQKNEVARHRQNLKNWAPEFSGAASVEAVESILSGFSPSYRQVITSWVPRDPAQDGAQWGPAIGAYLLRLKPDDQLEGPAKFIAIVNPDLMELELARSDRVDEAIDRTIKRLMQVKTAKQVFPSMRKNAPAEPKLINVIARGDEKEQNAQLPVKVEVPAKPIGNLRMVSDGPFLRIG